MAENERSVARLAIVAASAVVLVVSAGLLAGATHEATGPAVIRLNDKQTGDVQVGGSVERVGSTEIARLRLFGSSSSSRPIGHAVLTCMSVGSGERSCIATYILPRGTLETSGILKTRLFYTQAVTGGTGLYDNARGTLTVTAKSFKPRRELLLFRLSG